MDQIHKEAAAHWAVSEPQIGIEVSKWSAPLNVCVCVCVDMCLCVRADMWVLLEQLRESFDAYLMHAT
jgi:hypothetical protein